MVDHACVACEALHTVGLLDMWVVAGELICIEVDGPSHFSENTRRPTGNLRARNRMLEARGCTVISIPYFTWWYFQDRPAQAHYLQQVGLGFMPMIA